MTGKSTGTPAPGSAPLPGGISRPGRKRLSPAARRAQIIESARIVFSAAGASRTRIRDIADEAGITEAFLYQHFDSRDELFKLAVLDPLDACVASLAKRIRTLARGADFPQADLHRRLHEAFLADVIGMIPLMAAAQFSDPIKGPQFYGETLYPKIRANVASLMKGFTGFATRSIEMDVAIRALLGVHFAVALETVLGGERLDSARVAEDLTRMFGPGLTHAKSALETVGRAREADLVPDPARADASGVRIAVREVPAARQRLSRADRVDAILAAARDVFLQHGHSGARSRRLAEKAGITEAFMFRIFESKEHLYEAAILEPLEAAFADFARRVAGIGAAHSGIAFLAGFNREALPFFIENGPLCVAALFSELGEGQKYFRQVLTPYLRSIENVLAAQPGLIDPGVDPRTARRAIFGAHWGISFDDGHRSYPVDSGRIVSILTQLLTIGAHSGVKAWTK